METSNTRIKQLTVIAEALLTAAFLTACSSGNTSAPVVPRANAGSGSPSSDVFQEVLQLRPGASGTSPHAVAKPLVQRSPNVYVADAGNNAVYEILRAGGYTQMLTLGSGFNGPSGVAVDPKGDVFVADTKNGAVKEMLAVKGGKSQKPGDQNPHDLDTESLQRRSRLLRQPFRYEQHQFCGVRASSA